MSVVYDEYSKARVGWFLGLTGWQAVVVAASTVPVWWAAQRQAWGSAALFLLVAAVITALTVVPVRGRPAIGWICAVAGFALGGLTGWSRWRSRAASGQVADLAAADLPGALAGIELHEGPPTGLAGTRIAIIQNHATRTWAVTARVVHPGLGMRDTADRARMGKGLSELIDEAERTDLIDELLFVVRTVPEDGAERDDWIARHRRADGPAGARAVNDDLQRVLTSASVRTEAFVTLVVPETRIAKAAREAGGGVEGRAQVLYGLMAEVESQLKAGMGMDAVSWLTSQELAIACRTGFAPGDRASIVDALAAAGRGEDVNPEVPLALAGPSGAEAAVRHYGHDAWNSVSATIMLPDKGAVIGALGPVLAPTTPGERRSLLVAFPILARTRAARAAAGSEWAADMGQALRDKAGVKQTTRLRDEAHRVRRREAKLSRGSALTRPYAVCTVTVAKTARIAEYGRLLDASIRRAGFAPLRLDLSQDVAFAASVVPLGVSLTRKGDA